MYKITFECETITPMFLAGEDGTTPELRAPSIKGALRFWWRAMNGHLSVEELRKKEAEIFGGVGEKEGKSKIILNVHPINIRLGNYAPLPHHSGRNDCEPCNELGYQECRKGFKSRCFLPGNVFKLSILFIDEKEAKISIKDLKSIIRLFIVFGGIGKRSRRGFGSLKILSINDNNEEAFELTINNIFNFLDSTMPGQFILKEKENAILTTKKGDRKNYPYIERIEIGKEYDSWQTLLEVIGKATHKHNNPSKDCSLGKVRGRTRFASPVYVSIIEAGSKYRPIITTLFGAPKDRNCVIDKNKQREFINEILG